MREEAMFKTSIGDPIVENGFYLIIWVMRITFATHMHALRKEVDYV